MKRNIIWIICFFIFLILLILDLIHLWDEPYILNSEQFDFAFQNGIFFAYLMEGLFCCIDDLFIKRIFKKKDPT